MKRKHGTLRAKKSLSEVSEVERILKYIPFNVREDIVNAPKERNKVEMLRAWLGNNQPQFMILFNTNYDYEITKFIEIMGLTVSTSKSVGQLQREGAFTEYDPKKEDIKPRKIVFAKRGKTSYKRTESIKFENKQFLKSFIKIRLAKGQSFKTITKDYNSVANKKGWETRTVKSVQNVTYRNNLRKPKGAKK